MNTIACYKSRQGASLALVAMDKQGIDGNWSANHLSDHGIYVVKARTQDVAAAHEGISKLAEEHTAADADAVHCPECQSIHVEFPARPEMSATAAVTSKIAEATGMKAPSFLCHNCQYSWSPEQA